jgi:hypothetical protein
MKRLHYKFDIPFVRTITELYKMVSFEAAEFLTRLFFPPCGLFVAIWSFLSKLL